MLFNTTIKNSNNDNYCYVVKNNFSYIVLLCFYVNSVCVYLYVPNNWIFLYDVLSSNIWQ